MSFTLIWETIWAHLFHVSSCSQRKNIQSHLVRLLQTFTFYLLPSKLHFKLSFKFSFKLPLSSFKLLLNIWSHLKRSQARLSSLKKLFQVPFSEMSGQNPLRKLTVGDAVSFLEMMMIDVGNGKYSQESVKLDLQSKGWSQFLTSDSHKFCAQALKMIWHCSQ